MCGGSIEIEKINRALFFRANFLTSVLRFFSFSISDRRRLTERRIDMSNARLISSVALSLIAFLLSVWQTAIFVSQNSLTSTKAFFCLGCVLRI